MVDPAFLLGSGGYSGGPGGVRGGAAMVVPRLGGPSPLGDLDRGSRWVVLVNGGTR